MIRLLENRLLITEAELVNEQQRSIQDVLIVGGRISRIDNHISDPYAEVISAKGKYLLPGLIDTHVHFREPGYTEKGTLATESVAAVLGGVTSFLEMPNTFPVTTTYERLEQKCSLASEASAANYGFYIGATEHNVSELLSMPKGRACGVKVFMGSSTGDLLVEDERVLERIFSEVPMLIAVHCEDEPTMIRARQEMEKKNRTLSAADHPLLRPREGCLASTQRAIDLARRHETQLHVLHISSEEELSLFSDAPMATKQITGEACMHHLTFCDTDYEASANLIKVNPAIKTVADREAIWGALLRGQLDIIGSDHAPHTRLEKQQSYLKAPSGAPMVQFSLYVLLEACREGRLSLEQLVEKFSHNPARRFSILGRGFLREGYFADLVLLEKSNPWTLTSRRVASLCKWSPLEGRAFHYRVSDVFVFGQRVVSKGKYIAKGPTGQRLSFTSI